MGFWGFGVIGVIGVNGVIGVIGVNGVFGVNGVNSGISWTVTQLVKYYFVQKALDSNLNNSINEFYEFRNFMNTWSQEEPQLHESFVNRLRM